jgi:hypothetical protein
MDMAKNDLKYLIQISKIQEVLGSPSPEETAFIRNAKARC